MSQPVSICRLQWTKCSCWAPELGYCQWCWGVEVTGRSGDTALHTGQRWTVDRAVPWRREGRQSLLARAGADRTAADSRTEGTQVERKGWGQLGWALDQRILREFGTKCFNSNTDVGYLESTEPAERQSEITRSSGLPYSKNNCHVNHVVWKPVWSVWCSEEDH